MGNAKAVKQRNAQNISIYINIYIHPVPSKKSKALFQPLDFFDALICSILLMSLHSLFLSPLTPYDTDVYYTFHQIPCLPDLYPVSKVACTASKLLHDLTFLLFFHNMDI